MELNDLDDKATEKALAIAVGVKERSLPLAPNCHRLDPPLDGWYMVAGRTVVLSFVIAREEGAHVIDLLAQWMTEYDVIQVPNPSSRMRGICERRGFKSELIWASEMGEHVECMVWRWKV